MPSLDIHTIGCGGGSLCRVDAGGVLHVGYSPGSALLDPFGGGSPVEVEYRPFTQWIAGVGVGARHPLPWALDLEVHVDRFWFGLEAVHRRGEETVEETLSPGSWMARCAISRRLTRFGGGEK